MLVSLFVISLFLSQTFALFSPTQTPTTSPKPVPGSSLPQTIPEEKAAGPVANVPNRGYNAASAESASSVASAVGAERSQYFSNLAAQNAIGISLGTPKNSLPDPCGPALQSPGGANSKPTCHAYVNTSDIHSQQYYGVQCLNQNLATNEINEASCSDAMETICYQISGLWDSKYQHTNRWIWSTENGNCTFGYWLPKGGAPPPSYQRCVDQIYGPMQDFCATAPQYDTGSVNLKELPASSADGITSNGTAVDPRWPSYVMVAQRSYWGVNSEDST